MHGQGVVRGARRGRVDHHTTGALLVADLALARRLPGLVEVDRRVRGRREELAGRQVGERPAARTRADADLQPPSTARQPARPEVEFDGEVPVDDVDVLRTVETEGRAPVLVREGVEPEVVRPVGGRAVVLEDALVGEGLGRNGSRSEQTRRGGDHRCMCQTHGNLLVLRPERGQGPPLTRSAREFRTPDSRKSGQPRPTGRSSPLLPSSP